MTTIYRKPAPYRKPQTYRGDEVIVPVVSPNTLGGAALPWLDADDHFAETEFLWQQGAANESAVSAPWSKLNPIASVLNAAWVQATPLSTSDALRWGTALANFSDRALPWSAPAPHATQAALPWQQFAQQLAADAGLPWGTPAPQSFSAALRWAAFAQYAASRSLLWKRLIELGAHVALPWGTGSNYTNGYVTPFSNPPDDGSALAFPDLPVYIMIPSITAVVISSGADLKPLSVRIDGDVDSFCWTFEMQIPPATFALVNPSANSDPVEIRITVNGFAWSFIVESYSDNRKWGARGYTVRGRSRSAILSDDYAPTRTLLETSDYNIAQLADHELTSTGWTMIWDAVDYLVPGGTWTYADLAPIAALQQLAAAVGATIETDPDALNIHAKPRYPVKPWSWPSSTPDFILPTAILAQAGGDWRGGNNANGIYVYPRNSTSGAWVRITGSGGADLLPMIIDPLLTDSGGQAARGTQELAKAGRSKQETRTIPLFPAPAYPAFVALRSLVLVSDEYPDAPSTTTTAGFTIAAAGSTQAVTLTSATGFAVGDYVSISDGTHQLLGHITALTGTAATVQTDHIYAGAAGDTMASGAKVTKSNSWLGQVMANSISASRAGDAVTVRQTLTIERQFR